jgi:hypothetical protein
MQEAQRRSRRRWPSFTPLPNRSRGPRQRARPAASPRSGSRYRRSRRTASAAARQPAARPWRPLRASMRKFSDSAGSPGPSSTVPTASAPAWGPARDLVDIAGIAALAGHGRIGIGHAGLLLRAGAGEGSPGCGRVGGGCTGCGSSGLRRRRLHRLGVTGPCGAGAGWTGCGPAGISGTGAGGVCAGVGPAPVPERWRRAAAPAGSDSTAVGGATRVCAKASATGSRASMATSARTPIRKCRIVTVLTKGNDSRPCSAA